MGVMEPIQKMLDEFVQRGMATSIIAATRDGLLIASSPYKGFKEEVFAAMCATLLASAETSMSELANEEPQTIFAKGENFILVVIGAGENVIIGGLVSSESEICEVEKLAHDIEDIIKQKS
jgi:predicted regulator of Ras-like GTPase activity (Roadblock/LC7/MglB family)